MHRVQSYKRKIFIFFQGSTFITRKDNGSDPELDETGHEYLELLIFELCKSQDHAKKATNNRIFGFSCIKN